MDNEISNAEKHKLIAKKVYPGGAWEVIHRPNYGYVCADAHSNYGVYFDLLETEDGKPTPQAKAAAFDVFTWLMGQPEELTYDCDNPCEAIFNAAHKVITSEGDKDER